MLSVDGRSNLEAGATAIILTLQTHHMLADSSYQHDGYISLTHRNLLLLVFKSSSIEHFYHVGDSLRFFSDPSNPPHPHPSSDQHARYILHAPKPSATNIKSNYRTGYHLRHFTLRTHHILVQHACYILHAPKSSAPLQI